MGLHRRRLAAILCVSAALAASEDILPPPRPPRSDWWKDRNELVDRSLRALHALERKLRDLPPAATEPDDEPSWETLAPGWQVVALLKEGVGDLREQMETCCLWTLRGTKVRWEVIEALEEDMEDLPGAVALDAEVISGLREDAAKLAAWLPTMTCTNDGPWPCTEAGCPQASVDCEALAAGGNCQAPFNAVWDTPPDDVIDGNEKIASRCRLACNEREGICPSTALVTKRPRYM
jgi:hypothetical protein